MFQFFPNYRRFVRKIDEKHVVWYILYRFNLFKGSFLYNAYGGGTTSGVHNALGIGHIGVSVYGCIPMVYTHALYQS